MNARIITEAENIRRTRFLLESKNQHDLMARQILSEGAEYTLYLQLNEAPIGDVVNKIKTSIAKMPKAVASKVIQAVRSLPKAALPLAATIVMSMAAQGVNAQQSDMQSQLNKLDSLLTQFNQDTAVLGQTTKNGTALPTTTAKTQYAPGSLLAQLADLPSDSELDAQAAQIEKDFADKNANIDAAAAADTAAWKKAHGYDTTQSSTAPQVTDYKSAGKFFGVDPGINAVSLQALITNNADFNAIKQMIDKSGAIDPWVIAGALIAAAKSNDLAALKAYLSDPYKNPESKKKK